MPALQDGLKRHGELADGSDATAPWCAELLAISPATINRYVVPAREKDPLRGISTTRPPPLLRASITIRKARDGVEATPGFFEADTLAHCGPTLKGGSCAR